MERRGREETSRKAQTEVDGPSAERHGREDTSRKAQTEVDGPSAERSQKTPARPKAGTEPRRMEKGNHGDRPRTGIRSANVTKVTILVTSPKWKLLFKACWEMLTFLFSTQFRLLDICNIVCDCDRQLGKSCVSGNQGNPVPTGKLTKCFYCVPPKHSLPYYLFPT